MRHAFLIIAHNEKEVLETLLDSLYDNRADVFLHIDAKADFSADDLRTINQNLHVLKHRIDARWGDFSLVEVEIALIEAALSNGRYEYLHLISGVDYPINGIDHVMQFCEKYRGKEFIGFAQNVDEKEIRWRAGRRFLFAKDFKSTSLLKRTVRTLHARLQSLPGLERKIDTDVKKGSQWCSITGDFARYALSRRDWIKKNFNRTFCPDELVMQTLCWNSRFRENIFDSKDEFHGAMRYIPWRNGNLCRFNDSDFTAMKESDAFFGRKFTLEDIEKYNGL